MRKPMSIQVIDKMRFVGGQGFVLRKNGWFLEERWKE